VALAWLWCSAASGNSICYAIVNWRFFCKAAEEAAVTLVTPQCMAIDREKETTINWWCIG